MAQEKSEKVRKQLLRSWAKNTSAHGFSDFVNAQNKCTKLFWLVSSIATFIQIKLIVLICCFAGLTVNLIQSIDSYTSLPEYASSVEDYLNESLPLPKIKICSYNRLQKSSMIDHGMTLDHAKMLMSTMDVNYMITEDNPYSNSTFQDETDQWLKDKDMTAVDVFMQMGIPCDTIFFAGRNFKPILYTEQGYICHQKNKSNEHMTIRPVMDKTFGKCLEVEFHSNYTLTTESGSSQVIGFGFRVPESELIKTAAFNFLNTGLALFIGDGDQNVPVTSGLKAIIGLKAVEKTYRKKSTQFADLPCVEKRDKILAKDSDGHSTVAACQSECYHFAFAKMFNCSYLMQSNDFPLCTPKQTMTNKITLLYNHTRRDSVEVSKKECVAQHCQPLCHSVSYQTNVKQLEFPSEGLVDYISDFLTANGESNMTTHRVRRDYLAAEIFFESMMVEKIEIYSRLSLEQIMADLGGTLGVYAGISLMTILQFIANFIIPCCCCQWACEGRDDDCVVQQAAPLPHDLYGQPEKKLANRRYSDDSFDPRGMVGYRSRF